MRPMFVLAALVAAFFMSAAVQACQSPEQVTEHLLARYPETALRARLSGEAAAAFVTHYNRVPPATAHRADEVLVFRDPNFPRVDLVELFRERCLVGGGVLARPFVDWLLAVSGPEA